MAELTFRSPGVGTTEIDLSGPTAIKPQGTPAGVIGTAQQGPAFVPQTVATWQDFVAIFGATDGEKQGPLAMYEWMKNARAGTFLRVLGVGTGAKRSSAGTSDSDGNEIEAGGVKNAGFTVGQRLLKANGYLGDNVYAHETDSDGSLGRTYMLGAFMSESNGSTFLSDSGLQQSTITAGDAASLDDAIGLTGIPAPNDEITVVIPAGYGSDFGGAGGTVRIIFKADPIGAAGGTNQIHVLAESDTATSATNLRAAINGTADASVATYGADFADGATNGIDSLTAAEGTVIGDTDLTADTTGTIGNSIDLAEVVDGGGAIAIPSAGGVADSLAGGTGDFSEGLAVPMLLGCIMTPSGVLATLSGSYTSNEPGTGGVNPDDLHGGWTGNVDISSTADYQFTMLLNGHIDTEAYPNRVTASLSPLSPTFLPNILNTDPLKIEEAGHLLYNYYSVHPNQAVVTGSGILAGGENWVPSGSNLEPVAFLLTSSLDRNEGSATKPNYEGFQDRFRTAFSPWVTSQKFGASRKSLFKLHSLDDGKMGSENFRIQIENLKNGKLDDSYGQFDVLVKRISPPDGVPPSEDAALETFNNYIGRRIGDYNIYYDFDKMAGNQRVVVEGTHPNISRLIRVEMHSDVTNRNIEKTALPIGYRGPYHLVTSGSDIFTDLACQTSDIGDDDDAYISIAAMRTLNEIPNPLRRNISLGTDPSREVNSRLPWGFQFESVNSWTEPNKSSNIGQAAYSFSKYFPHFATTHRTAWVGDNKGAVDVEGTILDSDRFNNNAFTLEQVQVHTKSSSDVVDPKEWAFAQYRRTGKLAATMRKEDGTETQGRFLDVAKDFSDPASTKFLKFTFPMQGGFDGVNVYDKEKSRMSNLACVREMDDENQGQANGPTVKTYMKALDVMSEKSDVDVQILAIPGIRETKVTDYALTKTEERFDAIYLMDIEERDSLNNVVTASNIQNVSVGNTVDDFKSRVLDSSFGAAYFPDVLITDPVTNTNVRCAPSVAVIGAFAHNDKVAYPWFAPAGFTRGALKRVVQSTVNLSRGNLDSLYDADVNPITKFPTSAGVVVFGQKTLLAAASSLDRVNVRRLLIDIRRKVRRIADTFLFEPNREDTLARFSAAVNPVLTRIQQQQGLDRFKVIIDTTTTTQADVENNTIRGKIFLQPTRSIEFISLDFVVTNNGTEI